MPRDPVGHQEGEYPVVEETPAAAGGGQQVRVFLGALEAAPLVKIQRDGHRPLDVVFPQREFHGRRRILGGDVGQGEFAYRLAFGHRRTEGDLRQEPTVPGFVRRAGRR